MYRTLWPVGNRFTSDESLEFVYLRVEVQIMISVPTMYWGTYYFFKFWEGIYYIHCNIYAITFWTDHGY